MDRGQRRTEQGAEVDVVEPDHGHVGGDADPGRLQFPHGPHRHLVIGADNGIWQLGVRRGEYFPYRELAADRREPALEGSCQPHARILGKRLLEDAAPFPRVRCLAGPGDVEQPGRAVPFDQVARQLPGASAIVDVHDVGIRLVRGAGNQHDRDAPSKPGQVLRWVDALGDQQPVDLRRNLLQPPVRTRVVGGVAHRDQHRPFRSAQRGLNAAQHLIDEQQAFMLDRGVRTAAFDGDEADHFLALAHHALRRAVGDVPQRLDDLEYSLPGRRANLVVAVHHP